MCSFTVFIRAVSRGGIVSGFCFWSFYFSGYANSDWLVGFLFGVMAAMASRDKSWVKVRWHNVVDLPTCAEAIIELMPGLRLISTSCQLQSENPHTFLHCDQFGISSHSFRGLTFCVKKKSGTAAFHISTQDMGWSSIQPVSEKMFPRNVSRRGVFSKPLFHVWKKGTCKTYSSLFGSQCGHQCCAFPGPVL